jgi:hypothetical protein
MRRINKLLIYLAVTAGMSAASLVALMRDDAVDRRPNIAPTVHPSFSKVDVNAANVRPNPSSQQDARAVEHVDRKYNALLEVLHVAAREKLQQALLARESVNPRDIYEIATYEREISKLLSQDEYALYERLRESEPERAHLERFAQQLAATSPLTGAQERELLVAKLKHKYEVQALELQANDRSDLSAMERGYARDIAVRGIDHYTKMFLDDVRVVLTEQQWLALEAFEKASAAHRWRDTEPHSPAVL